MLLPRNEAFIRFLLADNEYYSVKFISSALMAGFIPVIRPKKPKGRASCSLLLAYKWLWNRYLWILYSLRSVSE